MDNSEVRALVESFRAYRELLTPIQKNLGDFAATYESMKQDIGKLTAAFGGDIKQNLESIYKTLSSQAEKASDLSSRIEEFVRVSNKYTTDVGRLLGIFSRMEERIASVNDLEKRAETQIGRLDALLEEKNQNYDIKQLQRTLDAYNQNVQRVSEFINKDVADSLSKSQEKLETMRGGLDGFLKKQREDEGGLDKLLEGYSSSAELLKRIAEKQDVNEIYIFEILDRWAAERKVKIKK